MTMMVIVTNDLVLFTEIEEEEDQEKLEEAEAQLEEAQLEQELKEELGEGEDIEVAKIMADVAEAEKDEDELENIERKKRSQPCIKCTETAVFNRHRYLVTRSVPRRSNNDNDAYKINSKNNNSNNNIDNDHSVRRQPSKNAAVKSIRIRTKMSWKPFVPKELSLLRRPNASNSSIASSLLRFVDPNRVMLQKARRGKSHPIISNRKNPLVMSDTITSLTFRLPKRHAWQRGPHRTSSYHTSISPNSHFTVEANKKKIKRIIRSPKLTQLQKQPTQIDRDDPYALPLAPDLEYLYTPWTEWTSCSITCGGGTRSRSRKCTNINIVCRGETEPVQFCNMEPCPNACFTRKPSDNFLNILVPGSWGPWQAWNPCSATCGEGIMERYRTCDHPLPKFGGSCPGPRNETKICTAPSPCKGIQGILWGRWSHWSACSRTCGGGQRVRKRDRYILIVKQSRQETSVCGHQPCSDDKRHGKAPVIEVEKTDCILIQKRFQNAIKISKSLPGVNCDDSDHIPIMC
ncbi:hemicentin-1 [Plakobranchus ocellatus]|uniref:Hemicentin-1 n=1 Tax=Plakobranchus ocellatus TaxID=259542 RepID=A0AAV4DB69_9GAST|nr:hemicentin-1 [Plakobranchus ocellatus]